jgi:hypothetical protein
MGCRKNMYSQVEGFVQCEMTVNFYETTQCNIPKDSHLHTSVMRTGKLRVEIGCACGAD